MPVSRVQINDRWIEIANNVESIEGTMIEQYINDAMQSYKEVDPTVPTWAKSENKPTYTAEEIGTYTKDEVISDYETKVDATSKLTEAKAYTDTVKNDLLNGAGDAYDTLKELGDLIDDNHDAIDALNTVAAGKADKDHHHEITDVTGLQSTLDAKQDKITGAPTAFIVSTSTTSLPTVVDGAILLAYDA